MHKEPILSELTIAIAALALLLLNASFTHASDAYLESIIEHRASVDAEFRNPDTSPVPDSEIARFEGLEYFEIDPSLRREARFSPTAESTAFRMPAFNGTFMDFAEYGNVTFTMPDGRIVNLSVFQRMGTIAGRFSVLLPFRDLTNGETTYAGGRYLEYELPLDDPFVVDFNLAFNPYCAHDPTYACPVPPGENSLNHVVRAGERILLAR